MSENQINVVLGVTNKQYYQDIANAIRAKTGNNGGLKPSEMAAAINSIRGAMGQNSRVVRFMNGDDVYAVFEVAAGQSISKPETPGGDEGLYFIGWYTDGEKGVQVSFPFSPLVDTVLYARYSEKIMLCITGLELADSSIPADPTQPNPPLTLEVMDENGEKIDGNWNYVHAETEQGSGKYEIISELQNFFPFNQISEIKIENNILVKFPKFWMKWTYTENGVLTGYNIASYNPNTDGETEYFIPDAFLKPKILDGEKDIYLNYFALGKYELTKSASGASLAAFSMSGVTPLTGITVALGSKETHVRAYIRDYIRSYHGNNAYKGFQLQDYSQRVVYNLLVMMFFQHSNIQNVLPGMTTLTQTSILKTGVCDFSTKLNCYDADTSFIKLLGVENPYGHIWEWVDGVCFTSEGFYVQRDPNKFSDNLEDSTMALEFSAEWPYSGNNWWYGGYIKSFQAGIKSEQGDYRSYIFPSEVIKVTDVNISPKDSSAGDFVGKYMDKGDEAVVIYMGGAYNSKDQAGLWSIKTYDDTYDDHAMGSRVAYRPIYG